MPSKLNSEPATWARARDTKKTRDTPRRHVFIKEFPRLLIATKTRGSATIPRTVTLLKNKRCRTGLIQAIYRHLRCSFRVDVMNYGASSIARAAIPVSVLCQSSLTFDTRQGWLPSSAAREVWAQNFIDWR